MSSESDHVESEQNKRRKLRKGTRSCWNCKHRKVKCEFSLPSDEVCIACRRRNATCVSQEFPEQMAYDETVTTTTAAAADSQNHLADRLLRVEALLSQLVKKAGTDVSIVSLADTGVLTPSPTVLSEILPDTNPQRSPVHPRQDGEPFPRTNPTLVQRDERSDGPKLRAISQALCLAFPSPQDIAKLCSMKFDSSVYAHLISIEPNIDVTNEGRDVLEQIARPPHPDRHPVLLARQMLVIALLFQYFPQSRPSSFSEEPLTIVRRLGDEAIKLVTTNEELHGTIDALECVILETQFHSNFGNLRRAWLAIRRAMMIAQMMGVHLPTMPHMTVLDTSRTPAPQFLWHSIVYIDRFFSLLLGLPCGAPTAKTAFEQSLLQNQTSSSWLVLEVKHSQVTQRLLDRQFGAHDYGETLEIDAMLLDAAKSVPDDFWSLPEFAGPDHDQAAFWRMVQGMNQVKHYCLVNCLHLPYLLREGADDKYQYSKIACLMANREIIRRYNGFRGAKSVLSCCRPLDFVVLFAALSLVLAHLNMHQNRTIYGFLKHQRPGDRALVQQLIETMDKVASVNEDVMTSQSSCLMRRLMHIEADAYQGNPYVTERLQSPVGAAMEDHYTDDGAHVLHINIPYYGIIKISRQDAPVPPLAAATTAASVQKDGSRQPVCPASESEDQNAGVAPASQFGTYGRALVAPYLVATANIDFSMQPNIDIGGMDDLQAMSQLPYPALTATVDDWAFQGVDAAFFGNLMGAAVGDIAAIARETGSGDRSTGSHDNGVRAFGKGTAAGQGGDARLASGDLGSFLTG